ncbi:MAG: hypothetical protein SV598_12500 [Pseudomonadota bacterium]|nr:hypothetical protein [Pseudomonadota bacterium]
MTQRSRPMKMEPCLVPEPTLHMTLRQGEDISHNLKTIRARLPLSLQHLDNIPPLLARAR